MPWRLAILAIEGSSPVSSERPQPDVLSGFVVVPVQIIAPPPLGGSDMEPPGGPVDGAGVTGPLDEGLDEYGRGTQRTPT